MRAVIFAGGEIADDEAIRKKLRADDFIICADSGYLHANRMGLSPRAVIGDFDSAEKPQGLSCEVIAYPSEKDYSDTFLAAKYALEKGYQDILILGALGARFDHSLANYHLLGYLLKQGACGVIADEMHEVFLLNQTTTLRSKAGKGVSLIPYGGDAVVSATGLYYPLSHTKLEHGICIGISNKITCDAAEIFVEQGTVAVLLYQE